MSTITAQKQFRNAHWKASAPSALPGSETFAAQSSLPKLPVPTLEDTLARLKETLKPIAWTEEEYSAAEAKIDKFGSGLGPELQNRLLKRRSETDHWLERWWDDGAYLGYRDSVSYSMTSPLSNTSDAESLSDGFDDHPAHLTQTPAARAAALARGAMLFRKKLKQGKLSSEGTKEGPFCMDTYRWMFDCCRIPGTDGLDWSKSFAVEGDTGDSGHIIVIRRNRIWKIDAAVNGRLLSTDELESQIQHIYDQTTHLYPGVGVLAASNRDVWAKDYAELASSPHNIEILNTIHSSAFIISLEEGAPTLPEQRSRFLWHGETSNGQTIGLQNRWVDKPCQFIVYDSMFAGFMGEHSIMDGTPTVRLCDEVLDHIASPSFDHGNGTSVEASRAPIPFDWEISPATSQSIINANAAAIDLINSQSLSYHLTSYGKDDIKKFGVSPDFWAQMIVQLAYRRTIGTEKRKGGTYEAATTRKFYKGRTEAIRVVSSESDAWVRSMDDSQATNATRKELFDLAARKHISLAKLCGAGQGVDRHLLGLKKLIAESERAPALFSDPVFMSISTCTAGERHVVPDGFGVAYMTGYSDRIMYTLTSRTEMPNSAFIAEIGQAAKDLYDLHKSETEKARLTKQCAFSPTNLFSTFSNILYQQEFLAAIRSVNPPGRWKILVVDEHSQKILGSVLKQFDILEENVTQIEAISNYREPQPGLEAMYLIMPTNQNIDRVIRDFSTTPQYAAAHLFFIDGLPESLFNRLGSSPAEPHLRTLQELYINFRAMEARTFSVDTPEQFFSIYSPPRNENGYRAARDRLEEDLRFASKIISNVCITLNENPYIRYYVPGHHLPLGPLKPHTSTRPPPPQEGATRWRTNLARGDQARAYESVESDYVTKLLAFMVQSNLDDYKKQNANFGVCEVIRLLYAWVLNVFLSVIQKNDSRPRATLIITDRSLDMMTPLVHEFTYQAMANDLLPIEDGMKYTYKFQSSVGAFEDKTAILVDADNVWTEIRHMHMREAIDKLMADFNKFLEENAVFQGLVHIHRCSGSRMLTVFVRDNAANLNDMKEMLANLPQYQEQREKFSLHLSMAQECMAIFERDKLPLVATVEQNCATGLTVEGKSPKHLVEEMVPLLDSREVINMSKVRIIALYIQYREGVPDEDRRRLYQHARLSLAEQDAVNALTYFGVRISRGSGDKDIKKKLKSKPASDNEYDLSRYKPLLRTVVEDCVGDKLDASVFPYIKDAPSAAPPPSSLRSPPPAGSLRSARPAWHRAAKPSAVVENKPRILVFMAGGMTYSEIREMYNLSTSLNKDIYIGSTHVVTPRYFIDDMKVVELGGTGSRAIPNGLRDVRGQRDYQEFYDDRYYTNDGPRPRPQQPQQAPTSRSSTPKAPRINSTASYDSTASGTPSMKEEKKKKKGLFKF
ncbi:hypothetical protein D9757_008057 [Collybiopsis confluens]|uniref:Choline/carnitine acyltransferase domain-containing protein n=1 Tax=Collybiopsis confluens TaxID=2823264 RepID=A0A8H5H6R0_9AGAR|nr:hypothetical protein D9757_008057 [Collybiopsis confluens]